MISIDKARSLVLEQVQPTPVESVPCEQAVGRFLAETIEAERDSPPYRKSLVDGFALRSSDISDVQNRLVVVEQVFAGQIPSRSVAQGQATRIMTGAPVPNGADAVVMVEDTTVVFENETEYVEVSAAPMPGQNIQNQGAIMRTGEPVLSAGHPLRAIEMGLLAEIGRENVAVRRRPSMAILPTGDELVAVNEEPGEGQIRNSNGPLLQALARSAQSDAMQLGIGRDNIEELRQQIATGLSHDILVLSGGVSMGQKDFVPQVLRESNVLEVFHRVRLKPGKPLWFGVRNANGRTTLVFGLPGNPVSSYVCFQLFVRPAIERMLGSRQPFRHGTARLDSNVSMKGNRPTYYPARYTGEADMVELLPWKGSADQRTMCQADCLAFFAEEGDYPPGTVVPVVPIA